MARHGIKVQRHVLSGMLGKEYTAVQKQKAVYDYFKIKQILHCLLPLQSSIVVCKHHNAECATENKAATGEDHRVGFQHETFNQCCFNGGPASQRKHPNRLFMRQPKLSRQDSYALYFNMSIDEHKNT